MANTPGDFLVRRNNAETDGIPDAGTDLDATWDTQVSVNGTSITYSTGTFTLKSGKYLITYGEWFDQTLQTARSEIQARLVVGGSATLVGAGQMYCDGPGQLAGTPSGACILHVASDETSLVTRFYRTDDSTGGTVAVRLPDKCGVNILALDSTWNYGRYSLSADTGASTDTTFVTVAFNTNDEQDTGFSNSSGAVTITTAGRYLVCYSLPCDSGSGSVQNITTRIVLDDVEVEGTRVTTFFRSSGSTLDACLSYVGVIDVAALDVLKVQNMRDLGTSSSVDFLAGSNLQIVQLPVGNECIIVNATSGDMNTTSSTQFTWDTVPHIDTAAFTHTAGANDIEVDIADDYFFFSTMYQEGDGGSRDYPTAEMGINGDPSIAWGNNGAYTRGSGGDHGGFSYGALFAGLSAEDTVEVWTIRKGDANTHTVDHGAWSGFRLGSLFAAPAATRRVFVT